MSGSPGKKGPKRGPSSAKRPASDSAGGRTRRAADKAPPTPEDAPAGRRPARAQRVPTWVFVAVSVAVAGAALGGFAYYKFYLSNTSTDDSNPPDLNNSSLPHPTTIVPAGQQYSIDPGHHNDTAFTLARAQFVTGSFGASFNVSVYVMTQVQYQKLLGGASPGTAGSQYHVGPTAAGSLFANLPAGSYDLVFYAPGPLPTVVNVASPIQAM